MMTLEEMHDSKPNAETDDFHVAMRIISEQANIKPEARMWYMAVWVARLRERYVEVGRQVEKGLTNS